MIDGCRHHHRHAAISRTIHRSIRPYLYVPSIVSLSCRCLLTIAFGVTCNIRFATHSDRHASLIAVRPSVPRRIRPASMHAHRRPDGSNCTTGSVLSTVDWVSVGRARKLDPRSKDVDRERERDRKRPTERRGRTRDRYCSTRLRRPSRSSRQPRSTRSGGHAAVRPRHCDAGESNELNRSCSDVESRSQTDVHSRPSGTADAIRLLRAVYVRIVL